MIQQVPVRTYKIHPMQPAIRTKVERSYEESVSLKERELRCPHCNHYIASLYSDVAGHFKAKCSNCKSLTGRCARTPESGRAIQPPAKDGL